jgi:hypothetical protein
MQLNLLLVIAALIYGVAGLSLIFAPSEVLVALHAPAPPASVWSMQLLGAALLGLAAGNHVQRFAIVGGIFGRPVLLTNLHFLTVSFLVSLRAWRHNDDSVYLVVVLVLGALLAAFAVRLFTRPATEGTSASPR